jgi:predicted flap endonuclease-1-like 5' DNA nuclease
VALLGLAADVSSMAPHSSSPPSNRTALGLAAGGLFLLVIAVWGLLADVVWVSQAFYAYAWWAWILLLDGFCVWRRKSSLLTTRRNLLALLGTSSVTFWFLFEALNLRFQNWYYIGTFELDGPASFALAGLFVMVAFSTVFVGMFEVFDALGAAKILTKRGPTRRLPRWLGPGLQILGLAMALLAVAYPFYLAPLIWGSLTFLIDPWNYRRGNRSLLRDFEAGDGRAVARLFLAGLISGLVWESLNFAAPQKWIYTVRGLENLKLFEMPLLGFLGFPALAFDAVTFFSLMSYGLCGNISWEHPDDLVAPAVPHAGGSMKLYWRSMPAQFVFWVVVTMALMPISIGSVRLRLERLPSLEGYVPQLEERGIRWPRQLEQALADPKRARQLRGEMGWSPEQSGQIRAQVGLYLFKGIGSWNGQLLASAGVFAVEDLAAWEPVELQRALVQHAEKVGDQGPRLDWVRVWVLASRSDGLMVHTPGAD